MNSGRMLDVLEKVGPAALILKKMPHELSGAIMSEKEHINGEQEAPQEENQPIENTFGEQAENTANEVTLEQQLANVQDKYTRLFAEFDNYKKRTSRERVELIQSAGKDVIAKLLSVLDDFDRAPESMEISSGCDNL
ncbi:hypothetical protein FQR65_LT17121 [Abscondita terminalis]|nr:hypothetical protein FQR65_LT17121 [Abscondita terminalis]